MVYVITFWMNMMKSNKGRNDNENKYLAFDYKNIFVIELKSIVESIRLNLEYDFEVV